VERVSTDTSGGNAIAALSVVVGVLALAAAPAALVACRYSAVLTLHRGVAAGGALSGLLGIAALACARRGRFRAARSVAAVGAATARNGRLLGTLAVCVAIAAAIALGTDTILTYVKH
jgi:hypothetical protein